MLNVCPVSTVDLPVDMDAVEAELATLEATINSAMHRRLQLIRLIDESGRWAHQGAKSCAHWLSWRLGIQTGTAREQVRVATKLKELPRLDEELAHGRVTYSQVRAITRGATPATEETLIHLAKHTTASQLERVVRGLEHVHAQEDPLAEHDVLKRWVFQRPVSGGSHRIEAQLTPDQATLVMQALRRMQDRMREEQKGETEADVQLPFPSLADALVRIAEHVDALVDSSGAARGGADRAAVIVHFAEDHLARLTVGSSDDLAPASAETSSHPVDHTVTDGMRCACADDDALPASAETSPSIADGARNESASCAFTEDDARGSAETFHTTVDDGPVDHASARCACPSHAAHAFAEASPRLARASAEPPDLSLRWSATLDDGTRLSAETFRRLACDCSMIGVALDADGDPLDVGRRTRSIPPALWRAIVLRDRGCAFPGCTHDRFIDAHHIEHWVDGGETKKRNLVCLCTRHHHLVHEGRFRITVDARGRAAFFDARGKLITASGWTAPQLTPAELIQPLYDRQVELGIDDETAFPMWDGTTPDYEYCVDTILGEERTAKRAREARE
ncbi:MAG: DUF222 domain-containing protein [Sandaracinaceae bacterium]